MSDPATPGNGQTYRIGAVSRLTGVPADTLRVWERRYQAVMPIRLDSRVRLYGLEDVGRLTLIKRLVDRGDAISSIAHLTLEQLRERLSGADVSLPEPAPERPCRLVVVGTSLAGRLRDPALDLDGIECVGLFDSRESFLSADVPGSVDLILLEYPTLHAEQVHEIGRLLAHSGAARAFLIYGFASRTTLERLDERRVLFRRAPIAIPDLRRWCLSLRLEWQGRPAPASTPEIDLLAPIPPRRFTETELARIADASPTMRCECPRHLVDLVSSLATFELYCQECENRGPEDAALHAYLHRATASARTLMEAALARLVAAESLGIERRDAN